MRRLFDILIAAVGIAVLGFALHGSPMVALAFDGSAPVEVANGDVSLTCADDNRLLGKTTGNVDCLEILPDAVAFDRYSLATKLSLYGATQYDPVYCIGVSILALDLAPVGAPAFCGCAYETIESLAYGRIYDSGSAICTKAGTAISLHDRVKVNASGVLETALDSEVAVGVATLPATDVATVVSIEMGQQTSPVVQAVTHIAIIGVSTPSNINSDSFAQISPSADFNGSFTAGLRSTQWFAGNIVSGITCRCDTAPATGKTVDFELCRNNEDCGVTTATDLISTCSQITDSSSLECTDSSFAITATVDSDDLFIKQTRNASTSWCQYPTCRFAYTQTEY
jgi:hypothetical protein